MAAGPRNASPSLKRGSPVSRIRGLRRQDVVLSMASETAGRTSAQFDILSRRTIRGRSGCFPSPRQEGLIVAEQAGSSWTIGILPDGHWLAYKAAPEAGADYRCLRSALSEQPAPKSFCGQRRPEAGLVARRQASLLSMPAPDKILSFDVTPRGSGFSFGEPTTGATFGTSRHDPPANRSATGTYPRRSRADVVCRRGRRAATRRRPAAAQIQVVLNWFEELKRRVPTE